MAGSREHRISKRPLCLTGLHHRSTLSGAWLTILGLSQETEGISMVSRTDNLPVSMFFRKSLVNPENKPRGYGARDSGNR